MAGQSEAQQSKGDAKMLQPGRSGQDCAMVEADVAYSMPALNTIKQVRRSKLQTKGHIASVCRPD